MAMFSPDYANASSWAWNVTTDRQLPWQHTVQLSYVGRSASNLERARNINQLQPGTIQANPGVNANALRPYKGFGNITLYETTGKSTLQRDAAAGARRAARGLGYSLAYTLSRTKDDGSTRLEILPNAYDDSGYYGISALDRPHMLITQASYRTPELMSAPASPQGRARRLEHRWRVPGAVGCAVRRDHDGGRRRRGSGQRRRSTTTSSATRTPAARSSTARAPCGSTRTRSGSPRLGPTRPRGSATTCGSPASGICTCRCARAWRLARTEWSFGGTCSTC